MTTKKELKLELNRCYESLQELSDAVLRKERANRHLRADLKYYEAHSLNLKHDNNVLNAHMTDLSETAHALNMDNNAHTAFITAQSNYINYLLGRES